MPSIEPERKKSSYATVITLAVLLLVALLTCVPYLVSIALAEGPVVTDASPIFGVTIPVNYKQWELIAPAEEAAPLDELRAVVGNQTAIDAYQDNKLPFPDGTILVKRAWKRTQSSEFASATIPGAATTVQVMVKDSRKYPATGGCPVVRCPPFGARRKNSPNSGPKCCSSSRRFGKSRCGRSGSQTGPGANSRSLATTSRWSSRPATRPCVRPGS